MGLLHILMDILIPRFVTEPFCLEDTGDGAYDAVCAYQYREPGEQFDMIIDISYLNFFGMMLFKKLNNDTLRKFSREDVL